MHTDIAPISGSSNRIVDDAGCLQDQTSPWLKSSRDESDPDACALLLARVDLKWLMAGQGWWIDPHRFEHEALYADSVLRFALESHFPALRECAVSLQTRLSHLPSHCPASNKIHHECHLDFPRS